jgi:hypothetical protein
MFALIAVSSSPLCASLFELDRKRRDVGLTAIVVGQRVNQVVHPPAEGDQLGVWHFAERRAQIFQVEGRFFGESADVLHRGGLTDLSRTASRFLRLNSLWFREGNFIFVGPTFVTFKIDAIGPTSWHTEVAPRGTASLRRCTSLVQTLARQVRSAKSLHLQWVSYLCGLRKSALYA